jgi:hypothetical protein
MKNKIIIVLLALFAGVMNFSCEKVIPFNMPKVSKKLVVNGTLTNTEAIRITVSYSRAVLDSSTLIYSKTAKVKLYENDQFVEKLILAELPARPANYPNYQGNTYFTYIGKTIPKPGSIYKIEVSDDGYQDAMAEIKMPDRPNIISMDTLQVENEEHYYRALQITARISDKPIERNYYEFSVIANYYCDKQQKDIYGSGFYVTYYGDSTEYLLFEEGYGLSKMDSKFDDEIEDSNGFCKDDLFNGKESQFDFQVNHYRLAIADHISRITCQLNVASITEDYFIFKKSLAKYDETEDNPLAEKTHVKSNIQGGMGFIGGMTFSHKEMISYQRPGKK